MGRWSARGRAAMERLGYTIHRWPTNRFDGMRDALFLLRRRGYSPRIVVDAGANVGSWTELASSIVPDALFHVIEPQPQCLAALEALAHRTGRVTVHPTALSEPGVARVRLLGADQAGGGTGGRVARPGETGSGELHCPATTLDALLADRLTRADRTLLKLDLEGHELPALRGAARVLDVVEVIVTEVQFFEINDNGRACFADVLDFLRARHFALYDIAALSPRPRDHRLRLGDAIFAHDTSPLLSDRSWE